MNDKCRFHHLMKTFAPWIDDQFIDRDGHTRTEVRSPEGIVFPGPAENNQNLFGGLVYIEFAPPDPSRHTARVLNLDEPRRSRSRTANKHARRRAERRRNRMLRKHKYSEAEIRAAKLLDDYGDPPF